MSAGRRRRSVLRVLAVAAIVLGVIGGIAIWLAADRRLDDAVAGLARAPVGCDTVLDFDATGTYLLFVETAGVVEDVRGDCEVDSEVARESDELPSVTLTLVGPEDDDIDLVPDDGVSYDAGGSSGESIESVVIESPGDHVLRVESDDGGFVIAVGRDPNDGVMAIRGAAIAAAVLGVAIGVGLLLGTRRGRLDDAAPVAVWTPGPGGAPDRPMSPPGFPAPPPTTGTTAVVGPPTGPALRPESGPLPTPPNRGSSVAPIPGQPGPWGPPPPPAGERDGP